MTAASRRHLVGALISASLAGVAALPALAVVLPAPQSILYGDPGDPYGSLALLQDLMAADGPRPARVGVVQPLVDLPAAWLGRHVGVVAAYDAVLLLSFPLAAACGYLAAAVAGASVRGSVLTGLLFAFSPWHLAHAREHLDQAQVAPAALVVAALLALLRRPGAGRATLVLAALAVAALTNGYLPVLLLAVVIPVGAALVLVPAGGRGPALAVLAAGLVVASAAMASFLDQRPHVGSKEPAVELARYSARPLEYLRPSTQHPLLGEGASAAFAGAAHGSSAVEQTLTLGFTPLALALAGGGAMLRRGGHARRAALVLLAGAALAVWASLPAGLGASAYVSQLFPWVRAVARYGLIVQLCVAILAGVAAGRSGRPAFVAIALLCLFEYAYRPAAHTVEPPAVSALLEERASAIVDVPAVPYRYVRLWRSIGHVAVLGRGQLAELDAFELDADAVRRLAAVGVSHVVVHDGRPLPVGLREVAAHSGHRVAEVMAAPADVVVRARAGFDLPEPGGRWLLGGRGVIRVEPGPELDRLDGRLVFTALSPSVDRQLTLTADGTIRTLAITASEERFEIPLTVPTPGVNVALEVRPPARVGEAGGGDDARALSILFRAIEFEASVRWIGDRSWRYGVGFHDVEPDGRRWLAGDARLEVDGLPGKVLFEATALRRERRLTVDCDGREAARVSVPADSWRRISIPMTARCRSVELRAGEAVRISRVVGGTDERSVTVALRGLRVLPLEGAGSPGGAGAILGERSRDD